MGYEYDSTIEDACDEAAYYIGRNLRKWGRVNVMQYKSKFSSVRVYCHFGYYEVIHGLCYPGHAWFRFPRWFMNIDRAISKVIRGPVNFVLVPLQKLMYRWLYKRANEKWPILGDRLLGYADWSELLVGLPIYSEAKASLDAEEKENEDML